MPYTSTSATVGPDITNQTIDLPLDRGRLKAATLSLDMVPAQHGVAYGTLRLYAEKHADQQIICELASGWIGERMSLSWTGDIPLSNGLMLSADILAEIAVVGRIAAVVDLEA